ncbi:unnamed protein product [Calypogeia fissa]
MSNVAVYVRFRPQDAKEARDGTSVVPPESADNQSFALKDENYVETTFSFDRVFYKDSSQVDVYDAVALPISRFNASKADAPLLPFADVMNAINGTILAYGQTGAGKTYTMEGPDMLIDSAEMKGILPRVAQSIFEFIEDTNATSEFILKLSMVEIYKEKIRDLFDASKDNLQVKEDKEHGIFVAGATEAYVQSKDKMVKLLEAGITNRTSGATQMNSRSSRSHCVSMLTIQQIDTKDQSMKIGKLYLVDLAGSEKVEKTGVEGAVLEEAKMINKSLSALGNVINSLTSDKAVHVPYRDSKLTRILQESLGGNSRTTLLCCCSPSSLNYAETLSTLRFGARAKQIKNKPKVNAQPGRNDLERLLEKSRQEYEELRTQFLLLNARLGIPAEGATLVNDAQILNSRGQDVPNFNLYQLTQSFGKNGPASWNGIMSRVKDLFIAEGVIPSSSTSEFESANHIVLEDIDKSQLSGLAGIERDFKHANDTVDKTLHLLETAVVDLGRKCEKLLRENEELKTETMALQWVLAHTQTHRSLGPRSDSQDRGSPTWRGGKGLSWRRLREVDVQQENSSCPDISRSNEGTNPRIPVWSFLCRIVARTALRPRLTPLTL